MKTIIALLICVMTIDSYAQEIEIDYFPEQKKGVTNESYNKGKKGLEGVYKTLKKEYKLTQSVYWNLSVSLNSMGEQPKKVFDLLVKAKEANADSFCIVVDAYLNGKDIKSSLFYKTIGDDFLDIISYCENIDVKPPSLEERMSDKEKLDLSGLNESLIDQLILLMEKDMRYRGRSMKYMKDNKEAFIKLDLEVRENLIKLFEKYGYAGKDIVGVHYQNYMCIFLEHVGEITTQEKYLPIVAKAFKNNQLQDVPFKMLIDRIYTTKIKKQIFGSHAGYPYADDKTIAEVKSKYGL